MDFVYTALFMAVILVITSVLAILWLILQFPFVGYSRPRKLEVGKVYALFHGNITQTVQVLAIQDDWALVTATTEFPPHLKSCTPGRISITGWIWRLPRSHVLMQADCYDKPMPLWQVWWKHL